MNNLGKLQNTYGPQNAIKATISIFGLLFCTLPLLITALGIISGAPGFPFLTLLTLIGIPGGILGIFLLRSVAKINKFEVKIYENGVFSSDKDGEHTAQWSEIENLGVAILVRRAFGITSRTFVLTVITTKAEGFKISSIVKNAEEIANRLISEAEAHKIPVYKGEQLPQYYEQMFHQS